MGKPSLQFGRNNIGYAVLAEYPNRADAPVVVSIHLGEKFAQSHMRQMQARGRRIRFFVRPVRLEALHFYDGAVVHEQDAQFI